MTERHLIDPELLPALDSFPGEDKVPLTAESLQATRKISAQMIAADKKRVREVDGLAIEERTVSGVSDGPTVPVRLYIPEEREAELPVLLWLHHGGFVLGGLDSDHHDTARMAKAGECMVVSVDYRLAPEHPYPAPLEDCYAVLKWLYEEAESIGVDRSRIAIGGSSAGGGAMAAGLTLLARDRGEVQVAFQLLIYPALDDRNTAPAGEGSADTLVWTRGHNIFAWSSYLNGAHGTDSIDYYAAAGRAEDLSALPPTFIAVGDVDLFAQENLSYAERLTAAKVPVEIHVYPGACHGFNNFAANAEVSKRFVLDRNRALKRALHQKGL